MDLIAILEILLLIVAPILFASYLLNRSHQVNKRLKEIATYFDTGIQSSFIKGKYVTGNYKGRIIIFAVKILPSTNFGNFGKSIQISTQISIPSSIRKTVYTRKPITPNTYQVYNQIFYKVPSLSKLETGETDLVSLKDLPIILDELVQAANTVEKNISS